MRSQSLAVVPIFTAMIVGSNFALAQFPNVKLLDTLVFVASFTFGFGTGAAVAVLSETIWSFVSPWGIGGAITPFLVGGELLFAAAGWGASKAWGGGRGLHWGRNVLIGSLLAISAFLWDLETNVGTALLASWPDITFARILAYEIAGIPFMLFHELSDFALGTFFAPLIMLLVPRFALHQTQSVVEGNL